MTATSLSVLLLPVAVAVGVGVLASLLIQLNQESLDRRLVRLRTEGSGGAVVVLRLRGRTTLGATFLKVVGDYADRLAAVGGELYLSGVDHRLVHRWDEDGAQPGARQRADLRGRAGHRRVHAGGDRARPHPPSLSPGS